MSWLNNLQTARKFLEHKPPLSRPGCWAYPDMLEVGQVQGSAEWNRAHFGAWCIVSAPLILGLDLTQTDKLAAIVPFITNPEAIAVNQQWSGHPGRLVEEMTPPKTGKFVASRPCSGAAAQQGWSYDAAARVVKIAGGCLDTTVDTEMQIKMCSGSASQLLDYNKTSKTIVAADGRCLDANNWEVGNVWLYRCNGGTNQQVEFNDDGTVCDACHEPRKRCWEVTPTDPRSGGAGAVQVWAKAQPKGAVAVLVINSGTSPYAASVELAKLGLSGTVSVRDIWSRRDAGDASGEFVTGSIPGRDSGFYLLSPGRPTVVV